MDGAHGLPKDTISLIDDLQQVLHCVGKRKVVNKIKPNYAVRHAQGVIFS